MAVVSCWVAVLLPRIYCDSDEPPLRFSIITFWNLSKQSHLIETPTKLQLKASIPGRFSSAALVVTCHPRILPLSHTAQPARETRGLKFWERRSQEAASSTVSLTAHGLNYHAEHRALEGARLKEKRLHQIRVKWHFMAEEMSCTQDTF